MYIEFANKKLNKVFNDVRLLQKEYGERARGIMLRMGLLAAADNLGQIPMVRPERCHQLSGNRKKEFAVDVSPNYRLVFIPVEPVTKKPDGGVDLASVKGIRILSVEDYH